MRPPRFEPESLADARFARDGVSGRVWHVVRTRVLYADTDRSDVVYHAVYLRYFELGRTTLLRDVSFPYREVEDDGFVYPIVDLALRFHRSLRYDDEAAVYTRPDELERVRASFQYVVVRSDGELSATGHTRHCALNRAGVVVAVDPKTRATWERFPK